MNMNTKLIMPSSAVLLELIRIGKVIFEIGLKIMAKNSLV